jgi:2-polyprenyl-3-methyl-5-hydroxy-6-metoxy-1,4-benzoquinol methylase
MTSDVSDRRSSHAVSKGESPAELRARILVRRANADLIRRQGVSPAVFRQIYSGEPPWEIGQPQPEVVRLALSGGFRSPILDVGCGRGGNALYLASQGFAVHAIDFIDEVVKEAQAEAQRRQVKVEFETYDANQLGGLGRIYSTVLDSGTFHGFSDDERCQYVDNLRAVTRPGSIVHLICFSDLETRPGGPRRIGEVELRQLFNGDWEIDALQRTVYAVRHFPDGAAAWLASISRR